MTLSSWTRLWTSFSITLGHVSGPASLQPVMLKELLRMFQYTYEGASDLRLRLQIEGEYVVLGDEVDLGRVVANILENARKYGKTPDQDYAEVNIKALQP